MLQVQDPAGEDLESDSVSDEAPSRTTLLPTSPQPPREFYFVQVLGPDDRPLQGARVTGLDARSRIGEASSDEGGLALVPIQVGPGEWNEFIRAARHGLRVELTGYGAAIPLIGPGHEKASTPQQVHLHRGVSVGVHLLSESGRPVQGVHVRITAYMFLVLDDPTSDHAYPKGFGVRRWKDPITGQGKQTALEVREVEWVSTTDAQGRCRIDSLPAATELEILAYRDRKDRWMRTVSLRLEAGTHRELEFAFGTPSDVQGTLIDSSGLPIDGAWVDLIWSDEYLPCQYLSSGTKSVDSVRTDESGRFAFRGVSPGIYLIAAKKGTPNVLARKADTILVPRTLGGPPLVVEACSGLFIRGRVLSSRDEPLERAIVDARSRSGCGKLTSRTDAEGRFTIGPLCADTFDLRARWMDREPVDRPEVAAGTEDLLLQIE